MRVDFLRGGFPDAAMLRVVVADVKIKVALRAREMQASNSSRVDNLPPRVGVESGEESVVNDNTEASCFFGRGGVMRPESGGAVKFVVKGSGSIVGGMGL